MYVPHFDTWKPCVCFVHRVQRASTRMAVRFEWEGLSFLGGSELTKRVKECEADMQGRVLEYDSMGGGLCSPNITTDRVAALPTRFVAAWRVSSMPMRGGTLLLRQLRARCLPGGVHRAGCAHGLSVQGGLRHGDAIERGTLLRTVLSMDGKSTRMSEPRGCTFIIDVAPCLM